AVKADVHQDDAGLLLAKHLHGLLRGRCLSEHRAADLLEICFQSHSDERVVLHNQRIAATAAARAARGGHVCGQFRFRYHVPFISSPQVPASKQILPSIPWSCASSENSPRNSLPTKPRTRLNPMPDSRSVATAVAVRAKLRSPSAPLPSSNTSTVTQP